MTPTPAARAGRPPKDPSAPRYYDTELHDLLVGRLRAVEGVVRGGRIHVATLAKSIGYSEMQIYRLLGGNRLTIAAAAALIEISGPEDGSRTLTRDDLIRFVLPL